MFTQTIKRWLNKLFAWWPWGRSSLSDYPQPVALNPTIMSEQVWRTTMDGPATQPGAASVAVEHDLQEDKPAFPRPTTDERSGRLASSLSNELSSLSSGSPDSNSSAPSPPPSTEHLEHLSSAEQQQRRLEFLRYLVQRGIVNENFSDEQLPEQYRREQS
jgi:hypothetical protein